MHLASREGYNSVVELLIKNGANPSIVNIRKKVSVIWLHY